MQRATHKVQLVTGRSLTRLHQVQCGADAADR